jgi:hypothetical protein
MTTFFSTVAYPCFLLVLLLSDVGYFGGYIDAN